MGGEDSHVVFSKKFSVVEGSVRLPVVVMQQPVLLSPKFGTKSSHIFIHSSKIVTAVCGIDCLTRQDKLFVSSLLNVKEYDEHAPDFTLHLSPVSRPR
jgi:hypothetical protein